MVAAAGSPRSKAAVGAAEAEGARTVQAGMAVGAVEAAEHHSTRAGGAVPRTPEEVLQIFRGEENRIRLRVVGEGAGPRRHHHRRSGSARRLQPSSRCRAWRCGGLRLPR